MTLLEAKDKTAQANNFSDWQSMLYYPAYSDRRMVELRMNEVAELYARSKWEEACDKQILKCMEVFDSSQSVRKLKESSKPPFQP